MEWSKLKNIILIILVCTNLCLLWFVLRRGIDQRQEQQHARMNAVAFLENRGVQVEEEMIPRTAALTSRTLERELESEQSAAVALLGEPVEVEAKGGEVYRYFNENGSVQFHGDGTFSAEFRPGYLTLTGDRERAGQELLERMDFSCTLLEEGEDQLTYRQLWQDIPLFNQQVTLVWEGEELTAMVSGRRLMGQPGQTTAGTPISEATALIGLLNELDALGDVCSRVEGIVQGYMSTTSLSGATTLTPVWRVTTDTGIYQLDLITGGVSRVLWGRAEG